MIPLKYNVRNLRVRWKTTLMTVLGTGLVVWSSCILFGLVEGLEHSLTISGDPLDLIVMRKGSIDRDDRRIRDDQGRRDSDSAGHRPRRATASRWPPRSSRTSRSPSARTGPRPTSSFAEFNRPRGSFGPISRSSPARDFVDGQGRVHRQPTHVGALQRGPGRRQARSSAPRKSIDVVGIFTAGGSAAESEVWADLKDVEKNTGRDGSVSCVQLRAASPADYRQAQARRSTNDTRFKLAAIPESLYFETQSRSGIFLKGAGTLIAVLLTFGAMFSSANTMFAAVSARTREIGTMRALGFSQFDILISFLGESLLLCALGGALGLLATIPLNALTYETSDFNSFASVTVAFRFGPLVMARRPDHDAGHGPLRRHVPRAAGRAARCHLGPARVVIGHGAGNS